MSDFFDDNDENEEDYEQPFQQDQSNIFNNNQNSEQQISNYNIQNQQQSQSQPQQQSFFMDDEDDYESQTNTQQQSFVQNQPSYQQQQNSNQKPRRPKKEKDEFDKVREEMIIGDETSDEDIKYLLEVDIEEKFDIKKDQNILEKLEKEKQSAEQQKKQKKEKKEKKLSKKKQKENEELNKMIKKNPNSLQQQQSNKLNLNDDENDTNYENEDDQDDFNKKNPFQQQQQQKQDEGQMEEEDEDKSGDDKSAEEDNYEEESEKGGESENEDEDDNLVPYLYDYMSVYDKNRPFRVIMQTEKYGKFYCMSDFYRCPNKKLYKIFQKTTQKYIRNIEIMKKKFQQKVDGYNFRNVFESWTNNRNIPDDLPVEERQVEDKQKQMNNQTDINTIKSKEQLEFILENQGERKNNYFLHYLNYPQKSYFDENSEFNKKGKHHVYNQVNQIEYFQNLQNSLKKNLQINNKNPQIPQKKLKKEENDQMEIEQPQQQPSEQQQQLNINMIKQELTQTLQKQQENQNNIQEKPTNQIQLQQQPQQPQSNMVILTNQQSQKTQPQIKKEEEQKENDNENNQQNDQNQNNKEFDFFGEDEDEDSTNNNVIPAFGQIQDQLTQNPQQNNPNQPKIPQNSSQQLNTNNNINNNNENSNNIQEKNSINTQKNQENFNNETDLMNDFFKQEEKLWGQNSIQSKQKRRLQDLKSAVLFKYRSQNNTLEQGQMKREQILDFFDYYNQDIINQSWLLPKKKLNRIELDLNDKQFFLDKVNGVLNVDPKVFQDIKKRQQALKMLQQKQLQQQEEDEEEKKTFLRGGDNQTITGRAFNQSLIGGISQIEKKSMISQSKFDRSDVDGFSMISNNRNQDNKSIVFGSSSLKLQPGGDSLLVKRNQSYEEGHNLAHLVDLKKKNQKKTKIYHSQVAYDFKFNNFITDAMLNKQYHRYCFGRNLYNYRMFNNCYKVSINKNLQKFRKNQEFSFDLGIEQIESHDKFRKLDKLSCNDGAFVMFEYIERNPLILQNIGMASKIYRYVYDNRVKNMIKQDQFFGESSHTDVQIEQFKQYISEKLGELGSVHFLNPDDKIPLIGQLTDEGIIGVSILENDLFKVPIYKQKAPKTDFLLVKNKDKTFSLRKIEYTYLVGQIEPKKEVYNPSSRTFSTFLKHCVNTVIKQELQAHARVTIPDIQKIFRNFNDQQIRKAIVDIGAEINPQNKQEFTLFNHNIDDEDDDKKLKDLDITPEEASLYEKMLNNKYKLMEFGIKDLNSPDKMKSVLGKYIRDFPEDLEGYVMVKLIWDQLNLTSWSLSSSFNDKSKMYLHGLGDPTNGHGGYSYIKKPQKTRNEKYESKEKGPQEEKKRELTGTSSDLRTISEQDSNKILQQLGYREENIKTFNRWERIDHIKRTLQQRMDQINELSEEQKKLTLQLKQKYFREQRITTKVKMENYQKEINKLFMQLYTNLTSNNPSNFIRNDSYIDNNQIYTFEYYLERERPLWLERKRKIHQIEENNQNEGDDDDEDDDEQSQMF